MIILITQFIIVAVGLLSLYCEVSDKYRNCTWHVSVRYALMLASVLLAFKVAVFAVSAIFIQILVLFVVVVTAKFVVEKILKKQMKIKNFKLKKTYLGTWKHHFK